MVDRMTPTGGRAEPPESADAVGPDATGGARWLGGIIVRFPIPFGAIAGLLVGLVLVYLLHRADLGSDAWLLTLVLGGVPLVFGTARRVWRRQFTSDVIASVAIVAAIALDQAFAGVVIVLMQSGGEALDQYAFTRASSSLNALLRRAPRLALRRGEHGFEEVPVEAVAVGDLLRIRAGDRIPVDGAVVGGTATIDESAITGEPWPRSRGPGETVLSGSLNAGSPFEMRALRRATESQYARIVELVRSAQGQKPPIQRIADRYALWFTPATFVLAILAAVATRSALTGLAVLVVATPCPLILATPIAVIAAINRAAEKGIVVKNGAAIEELGRVRAVLFDKTGTITVGQPALERLVPLGTRSEDEVLAWAASLETLSSHPLSGAVVSEGRRRGLPIENVEEPREFPGAGVAGTVHGHRVVVGSVELCEGLGGRGMRTEMERLRERVDLSGRMVAGILVDGEPAGALLFADRLRAEVPEMIAHLKRLGVGRLELLTGDSIENARAVASVAGIPYVHAGLLPEAKVQRVGEVRRTEGSTAMVGDGINDAAALATASVGVALGARGTAISAEAADVVLLVDDVGRVADGIELGQRMLRIARGGIVFGLGTSLVLMVIASFGLIAPAVGAILQEVLDAIVILNALRVR